MAGGVEARVGTRGPVLGTPTRDIRLTQLTATMRKIERLFVCVGAQKAGTTWLYRQFEGHADFGQPFFKEVHYFDHVHCGTRYLNDTRLSVLVWHAQNKPEELARWIHGDHPSRGSSEVGQVLDAVTQRLSDDWYIDAMTTRARWAIDFSPGYATIGWVGFAHMRRLAHQIVPCFVMRHPVERAWSSLVHEFTFGAWRRAETDVSRVPEADVRAWLTDEANMVHAYTDYWATLCALDTVFGLNAVSLVFHDEIKQNPEAVVNRLYKRLEVDPATLNRELLTARVFKSPQSEIPDYARKLLTEQWAPMVRRIDQDICHVPHAWRQDFGIGSRIQSRHP